MKASYVSMLKENLGVEMKGKIQGFGSWLNGRVVEVSDKGDIVMQFTVRDEMLNPMGNIHGGAISAIIDEILGFQLFLQSEENAAYVSMTMNIDFLKGATTGDVIRAVPKVNRIGRKTAHVSCQLFVGEKLMAIGSSNFMRVI